MELYKVRDAYFVKDCHHGLYCQYTWGTDAAAVGGNTCDLAVFGMGGGGFHQLVNVYAELAGPFGQTSNHGVVSHDPAGWMVHSPVYGIDDFPGDIQCRHHFVGLFSVKQVTLYTVELGRGDIHSGRIHGGFAVQQVQVATIVEHQVEIQFFG